MPNLRPRREKTSSSRRYPNPVADVSALRKFGQLEANQKPNMFSREMLVSNNFNDSIRVPFHRPVPHTEDLLNKKIKDVY